MLLHDLARVCRYGLTPSSKTLASMLTTLALSSSVVAQTWNEQGPNPSRNNGNQLNITPNSNVNGANRMVIADPVDANRLFVAGVNGGIWRTTNGGTDWSALTDNPALFKSTSISSINFDAGNTNTLVAGYGRYSSFGGIGGQRAGVMQSTDGGNSWSFINGAGNVMQGRNIYNVVANGNTLVASVDLADNFVYGNIGVIRSTNGGATWSVQSGNGPSNAPNGLPGGITFDLKAQPANFNVMLTATRFASQNLNNAARNGIYRSTDGGATWSIVNNAAIDTLFGNTAGNPGTSGNVINAKFAYGPNNTAYAGLVNTSGQLSGLFRSTDGGATWSAASLDITNTGAGGGNLHAGGQGSIHFSMTADPVNQNVVYVGGDRNNSPFDMRAFRVDASQASGSQTSLIIRGDTSNNSSPHADTRDLTFDSSGRLIVVNDGGVYRRDNMTPGAGSWTSLAGTNGATAVRAMEVTSTAYDRLTKALITGQQDNGTSVMGTGISVNTAMGSKVWDGLLSGDGGMVEADPLTPGSGTLAATVNRYYASQFLGGGAGGFRRQSFSSTNVAGASTGINMTVGVQSIYTYESAAYGGSTGSLQFLNPIAVNSVEGGRVYVGSNRIYESVNQGANATDLNGDLGSSAGTGASSQSVNSIKAGGIDGAGNQANVLYVGTSTFTAGQGGQVFVRRASGAALGPVAALTAYTSTAISGASNDTQRQQRSNALDLAPDITNWATLYVVAPVRVWQGTVTTSGGLSSTWTNITGNLTPGGALFTDATGTFTTVEHLMLFGSTTIGTVVVGTSGGLFFTFSDSLGTWNVLNGTTLPNAYIMDIDYNIADDILIIGTMGRGVWTLPSASVYFATIHAVPEPATYALMGISGMTAIVYWRRRRRLQAKILDTEVRGV